MRCMFYNFPSILIKGAGPVILSSFVKIWDFFKYLDGVVKIHHYNIAKVNFQISMVVWNFTDGKMPRKCVEPDSLKFVKEVKSMS